VDQPPPASLTPKPLASESDSLFGFVRRRILSGLVVALPTIVTLWLTTWLYWLLRNNLLDPVARVFATEAFAKQLRTDAPSWWDYIVAPALAALLILSLLFLLGYFVRSKIKRLVDWVFLRVPGVSRIYQAVQGVTQSLGLGGPGMAEQFQRVVLVPFPNDLMRSVGLVTNTLHDPKSGQKILCVVVLTGVLPPAGFTLLVPEDRATEIDWSVNDALQFTLTGGMTSPKRIAYPSLH
jgi:uncharacterized membrane protein